MSPAVALRLNGVNGNTISIEIGRRLYPLHSDFWDGNWLAVQVQIKAGSFRGNYGAEFSAADFADFRAQLRVLYNSLGTGTPTHLASFDPMEEQLSINIEGDKLGHFVAKCRAEDRAGMGNVLTFELEFDQTHIPAMLGELDAIVEAFPVRGL